MRKLHRKLRLSPRILENALKGYFPFRAGRRAAFLKRHGLIEVVGDVAVEDEGVLDEALVAAAQAVEDYEIIRYGSLIFWAR